MAATLTSLQTTAAELQMKTTAVVKKAQEKTKDIVTNPKVQAVVAGGAGGAVVATPPAAATGLLVGGSLGAAVGLIPALFTFGLSIPIGASIGGACGVVFGGAVGSGAGFVGGGAAGLGAYNKRESIKSFAAQSSAWVQKTLASGKAKTTGAYTATKACVSKRVTDATTLAAKGMGVVQEKTKALANRTHAKAKQVASDRTVQVTTASAVGGATLVGTGGAATGVLAGGALGAAIGVVPALFTFGLSIPVCALIGGGCGLVTGSAVGGTTGAVAGGVGGYETYKHREAIGSAATSARSKVQSIHASAMGRLA